jgi:hypothetical protein
MVLVLFFNSYIHFPRVISALLPETTSALPTRPPTSHHTGSSEQGDEDNSHEGQYPT